MANMSSTTLFIAPLFIELSLLIYRMSVLANIRFEGTVLHETVLQLCIHIYVFLFGTRCL